MNFTVLKKRWQSVLFILLGATLLSTILFQFQFSLFEALLYDFRMTKGYHPQASADIVQIRINDATAEALDEFIPLSLETNLKFFEKLESYHPRAVGWLTDFNQIKQENPESFRSETAARIILSAKRLQAQGTKILLGTPYDITGEILPPSPFNQLPHAVAIIHKDGNVFSEDKVTRRALTHLSGKPTFHLKLAQELGLVARDFVPSSSFEVPQIEGRFFLFRYHGNTVGGKPASPSQRTYKSYSYLDVLQGKVPKNELEGKILLVGSVSKHNSEDYTFTPYSREPFVHPKLKVHANILDSVIHDEGITQVPASVDFITTFILITIVLITVVTTSPFYGVLATIALASICIVISHVLFQAFGIWIQLSQALTGIFTAYYLLVPYRLILEYRKRFDFQKKHDLLTQVEELKTNFLSLVTHDLKTPVARIQGLTEVVLLKGASRLEEREKESLQNILHSTEELNHFITSILELNKVESNRMKITLENKDINTLIEKSVANFKLQAKSKNLQIITQLEPLFPIKIDPTLISKVLNNLIDNAIKYSPAESQITIQSREVNNQVEVSVTDVGIGMSEEEMEHLFKRFYRVKNDYTSSIKGTGLGLYLTRYFVEAHRGSVEVQSEKGKGSTFRILLSLDPEIQEKNYKQDKNQVINPPYKEKDHVPNSRC